MMHASRRGKVFYEGEALKFEDKYCWIEVTRLKLFVLKEKNGSEVIKAIAFGPHSTVTKETTKSGTKLIITDSTSGVALHFKECNPGGIESWHSAIEKHLNEVNESEPWIRIHIMRARNLKGVNLRDGKSDPYAEVNLNGQFKKTNVVEGELNPVWENQIFFFEWTENCRYAEVTLYDKNLVTNMEAQSVFLGKCNIPLYSLQSMTTTAWYPLCEVWPNKRGVKGEVLIRVEGINVPPVKPTIDNLFRAAQRLRMFTIPPRQSLPGPRSRPSLPPTIGDGPPWSWTQNECLEDVCLEMYMKVATHSGPVWCPGVLFLTSHRLMFVSYQLLRARDNPWEGRPVNGLDLTLHIPIGHMGDISPKLVPDCHPDLPAPLNKFWCFEIGLHRKKKKTDATERTSLWFTFPNVPTGPVGQPPRPPAPETDDTSARGAIVTGASISTFGADGDGDSDGDGEGGDSGPTFLGAAGPSKSFASRAHTARAFTSEFDDVSSEVGSEADSPRSLPSLCFVWDHFANSASTSAMDDSLGGLGVLEMLEDRDEDESVGGHGGRGSDKGHGGDGQGGVGQGDGDGDGSKEGSDLHRAWLSCLPSKELAEIVASSRSQAPHHMHRRLQGKIFNREDDGDDKGKDEGKDEAKDEGNDEGDDTTGTIVALGDVSSEMLSDEYRRLGVGVGVEGSRSDWRITEANRDYKLCGTYPPLLAVPMTISDSILHQSAAFRKRDRIPVLCWVSKQTSSSIVRCSQPRAGKDGKGDELLVEAVRQCGSGPRGGGAGRGRALVIVDARPLLNAMANIATGGGYENVGNYKNSEIDFHQIPNIHEVRESFDRLQVAVAKQLKKPYAGSEFFGDVERSKWLLNLSLVLQGARYIVKCIDERKSVLVHCSDGWDRTAQLTSLAMLLLDPYYRTTKGFAVLVKKEWMAFGHKFAERGGWRKKESEASPIFQQFLDCVYQCLAQAPSAFEFTEELLLFVAEHARSGWYSDFMFNSDRERAAAAASPDAAQSQVQSPSASLWDDVLQHETCFLNRMYVPGDDVLRLDVAPCMMTLWQNAYLQWNKRVERALWMPVNTYEEVQAEAQAGAATDGALDGEGRPRNRSRTKSIPPSCSLM